MRLSELIEQIEKTWSPDWAMPGDNIGLLCGDPASQIRKIILALDVTEDVLDEAGKGEYNLLFVHHSLRMGELSSVVAGKGTSGKIFNAINLGVAIYCAHSNLDASPNGTNTILAELFDVDIEKYLFPISTSRMLKLVIFVPKEDADDFRMKLLDAGIGWIGNYSHCSFSVEGEGTFLPHKEASPYIGQVGKLEKVKEIRLESILPHSLLPRALETIRKYHPYEEPAFDIYSVEQNGKPQAGYGIVGEFRQPLTLEQLAEISKTKLPTNCVLVCGERERKLKKVAILGGNGKGFVNKVKENNVDVFITGEIDHHSATFLLENGIAVVSAGHFATEWVVLPYVRRVIKEIFDEGNEDVIIDIANSEYSPFWILK